MNRNKLILGIGLMLFFLAILIIQKYTNNLSKISKQEIDAEDNTKISEFSQDEVTDGCIDEWEDYEKYVGEKIEEASNTFTEDDTHYLLKDTWGYIEVYYLDKDNNEYLYKKTSIATDYLSEEDIADLKVGIEVVGIEALNSMLEDFE